MDTENNVKLKHTGRFGQMIMCLGKLCRLFVFQSDWKVLPMSAIIAALVTMAIGKNMFVSMEGTFQGAFALSCVCIWNGYFNSIQSICRERPIIKREHRAGLHITSYVAAHLIFQFLLCTVQVLITIAVCGRLGMKYPTDGVFSGGFTTEYFITMLLVTYTADVMALMVSAIVKTQMSAMTVMPFMLIIQLVFSGFIALPSALSDVTDLMLSKWGVQAICASANYNDKPAVMIWNKMVSSGGNVNIGGITTLKDVLTALDEQGMRDTILKKLGEASQRSDFASTANNLATCWSYLVIFTMVFALVAVVFLEYIDRDKR